ncbi:MAG: hypothetical protein ACXACR_09575, partial [Candidatus Hodarchaeales archaeon]
MMKLSEKLAFFLKVIDTDLIKKQKNLLIGLAIYFVACIVFLFLTTDITNAIYTIIQGAMLSALYAILAMGFSLIYGVAKQLKLSIGGYYIVGAYAMLYLVEIMKIEPSFNITNLDDLFLLALTLLPICLITIILVVLWTVLNRTEFLLIFLSPVIACISVIVLRGNYVEGLYIGGALSTLALAGWYLELPKKQTTIGIFILGLLVPALLIIGAPVGYLSLM